MSPSRSFAARPLTTALVVEALLIPLALVLAWLFGLAPWHDLAPTPAVAAQAVAATLPLAALLYAMTAYGPPAFRRLERFVRDVLARLFDGAWPGAVPLVALLAGFGEELLFRGVLQAGLTGPLGEPTAIAIAALAFGGVHYVNGLYFAVATAMGVYLGALYSVSGSLLLACLVHALYDWLAIRLYLGRAL